MPVGIDIIVKNRLVAERRDLNVYHYGSRSAYMISCGNAVSICLGRDGEGDYLHVSVVSGPGSLEGDCWLDVPGWCDFSVSCLGSGELVHSGGRTLLRIPAGPPLWQLKVMRPDEQVNTPVEDHITIGDRQ